MCLQITYISKKKICSALHGQIWVNKAFAYKVGYNQINIRTCKLNYTCGLN